MTNRLTPGKRPGTEKSVFPAGPFDHSAPERENPTLVISFTSNSEKINSSPSSWFRITGKLTVTKSLPQKLANHVLRDHANMALRVFLRLPGCGFETKRACSSIWSRGSSLYRQILISRVLIRLLASPQSLVLKCGTGHAHHLLAVVYLWNRISGRGFPQSVGLTCFARSPRYLCAIFHGLRLIEGLSEVGAYGSKTSQISFLTKNLFASSFFPKNGSNNS